MTPESRAELSEILVNLYLGENTSQKMPNWLSQLDNPELYQALASIEKIIIRERMEEVNRSNSTAVNVANTGKNGRTQWMYNYNPLDLNRILNERVAELQSKLEGGEK